MRPTPELPRRDSICRLQDQCDPLRQPPPVGAFGAKLPASGLGQLVKLGLAPRFARLPFRLEPAAGFEAMERRVELTLLALQQILGDLLQPLRNGIPVQRTWSRDLQDQHVERALQQI